MKCKYGKDNMILDKEECMWRCSHCGYERFAEKTFYNAMKKEALKYKNKEKFVKSYAECVQEIVAKAWDKKND
jgi:hypothetical protein